MRNLVIDFELTILFPLILLALIVFWIQFRAYLSARSDCKAATKRLKGSFGTREEGEECLAWGTSRYRDKRRARQLAVFLACALVVLCAVIFLPESWKADAAFLSFSLMFFVSTISFLIAIPVAWQYAEKSDWLKLGICLLAMLMAAASAEHFSHQQTNARHITCPHCNNDDGPDDN